MTSVSENKPQHKPASVFKHPDMVDDENTPPREHKTLTKWEIIKQAFSLLFALQDMKKFRRATDQIEDNISIIFITGIITMILFMTICIAAVNLALSFHGK